MAGVRKHGAHRYNLDITVTAVGTAAVADVFTYDAYAAGNTTASGTVGLDQATEQVTEMVLTPAQTITGAATNFTDWRVRHFNSAGSVVDSIQVNFDAAAKTVTAFTPANFAVASGATVNGAGTATLTVNSGVALPWTLAAGDSIVFDTVIAGTGLAASTGGYGLAFTVAVKGA